MQQNLSTSRHLIYMAPALTLNIIAPNLCSLLGTYRRMDGSSCLQDGGGSSGYSVLIYWTAWRHLLDHAAPLTGPRKATYWATRRHLLDHAAQITGRHVATY